MEKRLQKVEPGQITGERYIKDSVLDGFDNFEEEMTHPQNTIKEFREAIDKSRCRNHRTCGETVGQGRLPSVGNAMTKEMVEARQRKNQ